MAAVKRLWAAVRMTLTALRRAVHSPRDAVLLFQLASFVVHLPADLGRRDLPTFLRSLREAPRPRARDVRAGVERVTRVRDAVLSLPRFWRWNTCYVRALTLYRFVDPAGSRLRIHVGIERQERLHGHAWITLDENIIEAPDGVTLAALREIPIDAVA